MTGGDDVVAVHQEMARRSAAGDHAEVVVLAERVLRRIREAESKRAGQILMASAVSAWLTSKVGLDPDDETLAARCSAVFERFAALSARGSAYASGTAIIALGVKIQLLLRAHEREEARQVAEQLGVFYRTQPQADEVLTDGQEIVRIASEMVSLGAAGPAAGLVREVVQRLADTTVPEARFLAATAQSQVPGRGVGVLRSSRR